MKNCLMFVLLFYSFLSFCKDISPRVPWHCAEALYCIEAFQKASEEPVLLDDRKLCLPVGFKDGVRVFDLDGNKIIAHVYKNGAMLLPASEKDLHLYIYFGFPEKMESDKIKDAVENTPLLLLQTEPRMALVPDKWRSVEISKCNDEINRTMKNSKPYDFCDHKKNCNLLRLYTLNRCRKSIFPFCARNVMFRGFNAKSTLYKEKFSAAVTCCKTFLFHPDYERLPTYHYLCREGHMRGQLTHFWKIKMKNQERIEEVKNTEPSDGLEASLFEAFSRNPRRLDAAQIFLPKRPFDTGQRFIVLYRGNLYVPEDAEYEFRVKANATRILKIDGKTLIRSFGETENTELIGTENTVSLPLKRGIHKFELLYHKEVATTWITAAWRKKDTGDFETLNEEDFSPAIPLEILSLRAQFGERYPLFRKHQKYALFTDKLSKSFLTVLEPLNSVVPECSFEWNGTEYPSSMKVFALNPDQENILRICPRDPDFSVLELTSDNYPREHIPIRPDLSLKLWMPLFLFDDEILDGYWELHSRFPLPLPVRMEIVTEVGTDAPLKKEVSDRLIPALQMEHVDRFAPDHLLKYPVKLSGASARSGMSYEYSVFMPGLLLDSKSVKIMPLRDIKELVWKDDGFYDGETRIIPLLHRPNLHELRTWELPKVIAGEFRRLKKVLVIAEDFGTFRENLAARLAVNGVELEFHSWRNNQPPDDGCPALASIPDLFSALRDTDAEMVLLIPSTQSRRTSSSLREEGRAIAFLIQAFREFSPFGKIKLTPPLPSDPRYGLGDEDAACAALLREYKRQYGIDFLELNVEFRKMEGLSKAYADVAAGNAESSFPVGKSSEIAELIADLILGWR